MLVGPILQNNQTRCPVSVCLVKELHSYQWELSHCEHHYGANHNPSPPLLSGVIFPSDSPAFNWLCCVMNFLEVACNFSNPPCFWLLSVIILYVLVYFLLVNAHYELLMQLISINHTSKQMIFYLNLGSRWRIISSFGFKSHRCIHLHWFFSWHHTEWVMESSTLKHDRKRLLIIL